MTIPRVVRIDGEPGAWLPVPAVESVLRVVDSRLAELTARYPAEPVLLADDLRRAIEVLRTVAGVDG